MAMAGLVVALVGGCNGGLKPDPVVSRTSDATPASHPSSDAPPPYGLAALTAAPLASADLGKRPALAVAIDIGAGAPAPAGLDRADLVYEEVAAPNRHRLVAIYQSQDADNIGPVGQSRPMDVRLFPLFHPIIANNGQPEQVATAVGNLKTVVDHGYSAMPSAYKKVGNWLYTSTKGLYAGAIGTPPAEFSLRRTDTLRMATTGEKPTSKVTVSLPGEAPVVWTDDLAKRQFVRSSPSVAASNLIILIMPYRTAGVGKNATVQTAEVTGSGACLVASDGFSAPCTWRRDGTLKVAVVLDSQGYPVRLSPGNTWIMYAPTGTTITTA
jgi:hypothetical protein